MTEAVLKQAEAEQEPLVRKRGGMTPTEAAYMRGGATPAMGSVPMSTSRYLNSPLFVHAFSQHALRRMGDDLPPTYDIPDMSRAIDDVVDYADWAKQIEIEKLKNPEFAAWLAERKTTRYDPRKMGDYKDGTLGANIREFILQSGYDLEFIDAGMQPKNDLEYMMKRAGECHDIQHMVTGFGPNSAGEHALILLNVTANSRFFSPELATYVSLSMSYLAAAGLMRTALHYHAGMPLMLEAMQLGIEAGQSIRKPLHIVNWEDYLDWRIDDIAADLGIKRGPGMAWADHNHLMRG